MKAIYALSRSFRGLSACPRGDALRNDKSGEREKKRRSVTNGAKELDRQDELATGVSGRGIGEIPSSPLSLIRWPSFVFLSLPGVFIWDPFSLLRPSLACSGGQ